MLPPRENARKGTGFENFEMTKTKAAKTSGCGAQSQNVHNFSGSDHQVMTPCGINADRCAASFLHLFGPRSRAALRGWLVAWQPPSLHCALPFGRSAAYGVPDFGAADGVALLDLSLAQYVETKKGNAGKLLRHPSIKKSQSQVRPQGPFGRRTCCCPAQA